MVVRRALPLTAFLFWAVACSEDASGPAAVGDAGPMTPDASASDGASASDTAPVPDDGSLPGSDAGPTSGEPRVVALALGETLALGGDEYLAFWAEPNGQAATLESAPEGSSAETIDGRLTPDIAGDYVLARGDERAIVRVLEEGPTPDEFLNYNYTPARPLLMRGAEIWVASPPSNAVERVSVDAQGALKSEALIPTGSWPVALAAWGDDFVVVSQAGRDSLGLIDTRSRRVVDAIPVGDEPADVIVDGDTAYVALTGADEVARVDLVAREVTARVSVGRRPRALAIDRARGRLFAASLLSSNAHPRGQAGGRSERPAPPRDVAAIDLAGFDGAEFSGEVGTILRGLWLDEDADRLWVAASDSRNREARIEADSRPHAYVLRALDVAPGAALSIADEIDLDDQPTSTGPAASPYTIMASGAELVVSLSGSGALLFLDRQSGAESARLAIGHDPRGLIETESGDLITYAWLDNELVRVRDRQVAERLKVGRDPTPERVKRGQQIFNDASFSKNADFSCNNCHVDGTTDGLVWNLLLDGDVNTLAFRNISGTGPFLWGGQLPTLFDFSREVLRLVGASATGEEMELLTEYMQSVTAPPNPHTLPGGRLTEAQERGRALFFGQAKCGGCHGGALWTSRAIASPGKTDKPTDIPSLVSVYDSGPWGREAQWTTLNAMIEYAAVYAGADLDVASLADLTAYVEALPADRLYLNASKPQGGSASAWPGTSPELVFSANLAAGQADLFSFEIESGDDTWSGVPGSWSISGRYARFLLDEPLKPSSRYRARVEAGLEGRSGRRAEEPIEVAFGTGAPVETDVSGSWMLTIENAQIRGELVLGLLQARGGQVSGAMTENHGEIEFDHVEGYISGRTLIFDPFLADTPFGELLVDSAELEMVDDDDDGYADRGAGTLKTLIELPVAARRLSLPEAVE